MPRNRDDVLEGLVALQRLLDRAGDFVMLLPDDQRVEHARSGIQRIHGRVDALLGDGAVEHGRGVEVGEGGGGRRVGQIVGGDVDRLHRCDRALGSFVVMRSCRPPHIGGKRRLIAHRRGDATEQRRHFRTRLG